MIDCDLTGTPVVQFAGYDDDGPVVDQVQLPAGPWKPIDSYIGDVQLERNTWRWRPPYSLSACVATIKISPPDDDSPYEIGSDFYSVMGDDGMVQVEFSRASVYIGELVFQDSTQPS